MNLNHLNGMTAGRLLKSWRLWALVAFLAALLGCREFGASYTSIGELTSSPQTFTDRPVRIQGRVTSVLKLPFVDFKLYSVKDETGEIVVRTDREPPLPGAAVRVKGSLDTVAIIGDQNVGLHLQEIERW